MVMIGISHPFQDPSAAEGWKLQVWVAASSLQQSVIRMGNAPMNTNVTATLQTRDFSFIALLLYISA